MEDTTQAQIDQILAQAHSLNDLSASDILELRRLSERTLVIDKFSVSRTEYSDWLGQAEDGIRGVEYDAQNARIILKGSSSWMHEAAAGVVRDVLRQIREELRDATGSLFELTGSMDCTLAGEFDGSTKQPDASLTQRTGAPVFPTVAAEVGINETTTQLHQDAERWLRGTNNQTKLVILVDIQETPRWSGLSNSQELSAIDSQQTSYLITDYIKRQQSGEIRLHGSFSLSVHLWYSDGDRQCILDGAVFSSDNWMDIDTIDDVYLRLKHLLPAGSRSGHGDECILFPLKQLVDTLQGDFGSVELDRASDLAYYKRRQQGRL